MVKQIVMASPMHTMPRLENENISHPKLYCCAPFSQACALWPARSDMPCEPGTPIGGVLRLRRRRLGSRYAAGRNPESVRSDNCYIVLGQDRRRSPAREQVAATGNHCLATLGAHRSLAGRFAMLGFLRASGCVMMLQ